MKVVEKILSERLLAALRKYSRTTKLLNTSTTQWPVALVGWSSPIVCIPLTDKLIERCRKELAKHVNTEMRNGSWVGTVHVGGMMSYIPWHNDAGNHKVAITVYMNETWRADDAGYFIYEDATTSPPSLRAIVPQRNLGLIYETPLMHSVALSNTRAPLRESLQIFIND